MRNSTLQEKLNFRFKVTRFQWLNFRDKIVAVARAEGKQIL